MSAKEEYSVERLTEGFLNEETQKYERAAEKERLIKEGYAKQIQEIDKALTKSLNQSTSAEQRVFFPSCAVSKAGNIAQPLPA